MNDDREFIDLDTTQNWSQLDVKRELDNLEVDEKTGKRYDFARGFSEDKKKEEEKVLLDGLTSGLNYIPEEFLMSADEKKESEMELRPEEEKPDVSWAYRDNAQESEEEEPFIPLVEVKKAEAAKAATNQAEIENALKAQEAEDARRAAEAKRLEDARKAQEEKQAEAARIKAEEEKKAEAARIEAEKAAAERAKAEEAEKMEAAKSEEELAVEKARREAEEARKEAEALKAEAERAREEAARKRAEEARIFEGKEPEEISEEARIELIREQNLEVQARKLAEANASDEIVKANIEARKQAREAVAAQAEAEIKARAEARKAAQKQAEIDMYKDDIFDLEEMDIPVMTKEERIAAANKNRHNVTEEIQVPEEISYEMDEAEQAQITGEIMQDEVRERVLSTGDTGVMYIDEDENTGEVVEVVAVRKKKKKPQNTVEEYAAWADSSDEEEVIPKKKKKKKKKPLKEDKYIEEEEDDMLLYGSFWDKVVAFFKGMSGLDYLVAGTGILVVIVAIVTTIVYSSSKATSEKIDEFAELGQKMQTIEYTGSEKLVAVADAKKYVAEVVEEEVVDEEPVEYIEKEDETNISVTMTLTSVKKDLKIKFINSKSKKLVGNKEFKVQVEDSKGKKTTQTDSDMDGIIYINSMEPGEAKVTMMDIGDKDLTYSREAVTVKIKENIDYKKIDVADEVKTESQINAKAEDTAIGQKTEGELSDTVEWVESSKTANDGGYTSVKKSNILDPEKAIASATPAKTASLNGTSYTKVSDRTATAGKTIPMFYTLSAVMAENPAGELSADDIAATAAAEATATAAAGENTNAEATNAAATAAAEATATAAANESANNANATTAAANAEATNAAATNAAATKAAADSAALTKAAESAAPTLTSGAVATATAQAKATGAANSPKNDTTTPLKDKDGNQLYIKGADGTYKEAKYADYYTATEFFRQGGEYKYTGWQEIDGQTYYFTKDGVKVTGEQVIKGAKYNFDSTGALVKGSGTMGIDVSKWNGNIDWTAVKNSGVSFVIIRCGYRGSSTGALVEDPKFKANIKGATDAGLKVGIYFFSQAVTDVEAVEEASMCISLMKGYKVSYPVFLDVEDSGGRGDRIDSATRTAVIKAFCETIKNSGYTPGVYANKSWLSSKMNVSALSSYKIWLAQYNTTPTYTGRYDMWQYSSKGSVNGIGGKTDLNLSYLGY